MQRAVQLDILLSNKSVQYNIIYQNNNRFKEQYSWIYFKHTSLCSTILLIKTITDVNSSTVGYSLDKQVCAVQYYLSKQ